MEHCNACNREIEDIEEHIKGEEHLKNIEELKKRLRKVYEDNRRGIEP